MIVALLSSFIGLFVLCFRLLPTLRMGRGLAAEGTPENFGKISIIVPARNEEANLPRLFESFQRIEKFDLEFVIIDDNSRDRTCQMIEEWAQLDPRFKLVRGAPRPDGWAGKNWACAQGANVASGDWFLFTDADTVHRPLGLQKAFSQIRADGLDLLSALPYHLAPSLWEKILGPFQLMVFISSSAFSKPRVGRLFAIGQFLLFERSGYAKQGGHEAIKESFADDLDLATACLKSGGRYGVEHSGEIYAVRMYASFSEFIEGWRRIFRLGFPHASLTTVIEIYTVIACLMMSFRMNEATIYEIGACSAGVLILLLTQNRYGRFSFLGALLAPVSLALFAFISGLSFFDLVAKRDLKWRGRRYKSGGASSSADR